MKNKTEAVYLIASVLVLILAVAVSAAGFAWVFRVITESNFFGLIWYFIKSA